jgi:hypothetical protein
MHSALNKDLLSRLVVLHEQLNLCLQDGDWKNLAGIDKRVRDCLLELQGLGTLSPEVLQAKQNLQQCYAVVMPACADACEKMRLELHSLNENAEGRSAYLRVDMLPIKE